MKSNNHERKHQSKLHLSFYNSLLFAIEATFISEQIAVARTEAKFLTSFLP